MKLRLKYLSNFTKFSHLIKLILKILERSERRKIGTVTFLNTTLGLIDILAFLLIGLVSSILALYIQAQELSDLQNSILSTLGIENLYIQYQILFLTLASVFLLILKSVLALSFTKKSFLIMHLAAARVSAQLLRLIISSRGIFRPSDSKNLSIYASTRGAEILVGQMFPTMSLMFADLVFTVTITFCIFLINPLISIISICYFILLLAFLNYFTSNKATKVGNQIASSNVSSNDIFSELILASREILVSNRADYFIDKAYSERKLLANSEAKNDYFPFLGKYVIEIGIIAGACLLAFFQMIVGDFKEGVTSLTVFLVASFRIAPSLLRVQQGYTLLNINLGRISSTVNLLEKLDTNPSGSKVELIKEPFTPNIDIRNLIFSHQNSPFKMEIPQLRIERGQWVSVIGKSGSGKSTLIDLMLGVLEPTSGTIAISRNAPRTTFQSWPGQVSYVPQVSTIFNVGLIENIVFGYQNTNIDEAHLSRILKVTQLDNFYERYQKNKNILGENGKLISGGERQRIALARALYSKPKLLIMDEPTGALDSETEFRILESLKELNQTCTIIIITHSIAAIKQSSSIVYLENGKILANGSYNDISSYLLDLDNLQK